MAMRGACMFAIAVQDPVTGSYTSAESSRVSSPARQRAARHEHLAVGQQGGRVAVARVVHLPGGGPGPAGRVVHLGAGRRSRHAGPCRRGAPWPSSPAASLTIVPVAVQVPLAGSYTSAPVVRVVDRPTSPTSTLPSRSNVAGNRRGGLSMFPVADQVPVAGSYSSAEVRSSLDHGRCRPPPAPGHRGAAPRVVQRGASPSTRSGSRRLPDPRQGSDLRMVPPTRSGSGTSRLAMPWRPQRPMGQAPAGRRSAAAGGRSPPPTPRRRAAGLRPREASCRGPGRTVGPGATWPSRAAGAGSGRDP